MLLEAPDAEGAMWGRGSGIAPAPGVPEKEGAATAELEGLGNPRPDAGDIKPGTGRAGLGVAAAAIGATGVAGTCLLL